MDLKEVFKIRPINEKNEEFMITIGNHLATEQTFKSVKDAKMAISKTDWNLVAAFVTMMKEAEKWEEKNKLNNEKTEE